MPPVCHKKMYPVKTNVDIDRTRKDKLDGTNVFFFFPEAFRKPHVTFVQVGVYGAPGWLSRLASDS